MDKEYNLTPECLQKCFRYCTDMNNTGYKIVTIKVVKDTTITMLDETLGMFYLVHTHYLHKTEKCNINSLGDKLEVLNNYD